MKTREIYLVYHIKVFEKTEGSVNLNNIKDVREGYINTNSDEILYS